MTTEKIELFRLSDAEEDIYYVPKRVGPNVTLAYIRDINRRGEAAALGALMERVLGAEAFDALCDYDDLTNEEMEQIGEAVRNHVLGSHPLEPTTRNPAGRKRS